MASQLKGVIDRLEGEFAVIKIAGDQELYWPNNSISFNFNAGDEVNIVLTKEELISQEANEDGAKNILRKIFQPNV